MSVVRSRIWSQKPDLTIAPMHRWEYDEQSSEWFHEYVTVRSKDGVKSMAELRSELWKEYVNSNLFSPDHQAASNKPPS